MSDGQWLKMIEQNADGNDNAANEGDKPTKRRRNENSNSKKAKNGNDEDDVPSD